MNVLNRIIATILWLVLLALAIVLAVFPVETFRAVQNAMGVSADFLNRLQTDYFVLFTVGRIVLVLLALVLFGLLLWAELKPRRPRPVRIHTDAGGQATVTTDSVARRLAWHIDQLADVISVSPEVTASGKAVNVVINLETRPEIDVPMKTDEVIGVAREVITERMGLQLGKIDVRIQHAPYEEQA